MAIHTDQAQRKPDIRNPVRFSHTPSHFLISKQVKILCNLRITTSLCFGYKIKQWVHSAHRHHCNHDRYHIHRHLQYHPIIGSKFQFTACLFLFSCVCVSLCAYASVCEWVCVDLCVRACVRTPACVRRGASSSMAIFAEINYSLKLHCLILYRIISNCV
jgi:hypothetical protein